jgi:hypothetical protein
MSEITIFTPAQCRLKAGAKRTLAVRDGFSRDSFLADADAWVSLAERLDHIEAVLEIAAIAFWRMEPSLITILFKFGAVLDGFTVLSAARRDVVSRYLNPTTASRPLSL